MVLLNPGVSWTSHLPKVKLITLTGNAMYSHCLQSWVIFDPQKEALQEANQTDSSEQCFAVNPEDNGNETSIHAKWGTIWIGSLTNPPCTIANLFKHELRPQAQHPILDTPWYVPNTLILQDLQIPSVKEEISNFSSHYSARLTAHSNDILLTLLEPPECKCLQYHLSNDLPTRFMVQLM
jgi:hypothetical protein